MYPGMLLTNKDPKNDFQVGPPFTKLDSPVDSHGKLSLHKNKKPLFTCLHIILP